jgi:hypothetical protein
MLKEKPVSALSPVFGITAYSTVMQYIWIKMQGISRLSSGWRNVRVEISHTRRPTKNKQVTVFSELQYFHVRYG